MNNILKVFVALLILFFTACNQNNTHSNKVVIGITADVETLNPMFAFQSNEATITELIFVSLVKHNWNSEKGSMESKNMLADEITWDTNTGNVRIKIRDDVYWSDSVKCTVDDIMLSFDLYSDPAMQSRALGMFENYFLDSAGKIDIEKSFEKISDYELVIHFKDDAQPSALDIDHPILPSHILSKYSRAEIPNIDFNTNPVTNGPYKLKQWNKEQSIVLIKNADNFLVTETSPGEIIFKIVPNYASSLLQLKGGELDFINNVKPEDASGFVENNDYKVKLSKGRQYDYIGWNNIQPENFEEEGELRAHKLFGDASVRSALSYALNRNEVLNNYLFDYGQIATGPISSEFSTIAGNTIVPTEFNIQESKRLLAESGWADSNSDGILDKAGIDFRFDLYIPTGEPRREFAANVFNNNFKELGVDANIKFVEMNTFLDGVFDKKFDAWMIGWTNPIPLNLRIQWYSNLDEAPFNLPSYQNEKVDELLDVIDSTAPEDIKSNAYKEINTILFNDQPFCFLYWIDGITVHSSRISNVTVNPLGSIQNCWEWKIN